MSFFDGLNGFRKPEVAINTGPLPSAADVPHFPNAQINQTSSLLGSVSPYEYGEPSYVDSQIAYANIPHKIQKIIPQIKLPGAIPGSQFQLSHAVDDGDVGFTLRINSRGGIVQHRATFDKLDMSGIVSPFINLVTANYLLAGIQRYWDDLSAQTWQQFMVDTEFIENPYMARSKFTVNDAIRFIRDIVRPFGIAHGSERQGGTHEGSASAVTHPVNFVTVFGVSGRIENIVNIWKNQSIDAGDDLVLFLRKLPIANRDNTHDYHLNHWAKGLVRQLFPWDDSDVSKNVAWQLVPAVFDGRNPYVTGLCNHPHERENSEGYDFRMHGYWHICRSQVMMNRERVMDNRFEVNVGRYYHDDRVFLRGALLECNFEPVFVQHEQWREAPSRFVRRGGGSGSGGGGSGGSGGGGSGGSGGGGSGGGGSGGSSIGTGKSMSINFGSGISGRNLNLKTVAGSASAKSSSVKKVAGSSNSRQLLLDTSATEAVNNVVDSVLTAGAAVAGGAAAADDVSGAAAGAAAGGGNGGDGGTAITAVANAAGGAGGTDGVSAPYSDDAPKPKPRKRIGLSTGLMSDANIVTQNL